jgi:hypothetical protein
MLKRFAVLAAILAAVAISLVGARAVLAADPTHRAPGPESRLTAAATPGGDTSQGAMPGMSDEEMAGMNHKPTPTASQEQMAGMSDEEMAGMDNEQSVAGSSQSGSKQGGSHALGATESRPLALVVGGFAAVNGAVLVGAGVMRRQGKRQAGNSPKPSRSAK